MDPRWVAYALRMTLASIFLMAGLDHIQDGGMAWAVRFLPAPEAWGWLLAVGELAAGLGLVLGALTPLSAAVAGFVAAGAAVVVFLAGDGLVWQNPAMAGIALLVLALGPGPASVDAWLAARRPALRRWLQPFEGARAERLAGLAFRGALVVALLGVTVAAVAGGALTSPAAARVHPLLGLLVFALRPVAALALLGGVAPRATGATLVGLGVLGLVAALSEYHAYALVGAGAVLLLDPARFRGPLVPRPARRAEAAADAPA